MFKIFTKLGICTLVVLSFALVISSGDRVSASTRCPNSFADAQNNLKWGVTPQYNGNHGGNMAGLIIHAYNGPDGRPIDMTYDLYSGIRNQANPDTEYPGTAANGQPIKNLNDRIFQDLNGDFSYRTHKFTGFTTQGMWDTTEGRTQSVYCTGWQAFGPVDLAGNSGNVGNSYVLDCGPPGQETHFWFSRLTKPTNLGADGVNGYWSVDITGSKNKHIDNFNNNPMNYSNAFTVDNGQNTFVNLIWHPQPPQHNPPNTTSECSILDITDGGGATINGKSFTSDAIRTAVRVYDSSGQVLVHGPEGQGYFLYFNDTRKVWRPPDYVPRGVTLTVQVYRQYYHNNSGTWQWNDIPNGSTGGNGEPLSGNQTRTHTCYSASCSVYQIAGNVPGRTGDAVISGTQYTVTMKVHNNGPLSLNNPSMNGTPVEYPPLNQNDDGYATFTITAPGGGPQNYTVNFTVNDIVPGLTSCPATVAVYQSFTLEPHATLNYKTAENPGPIGYNTYVQNNSAQAISAPSTSRFTSIPYGGGSSCSNVGPVNSNGPYNPGGPNYVIGPSTCNPPLFNAGDQFCTEINLTSFNQGYVGPGGDVKGQSLNGSATDKHCVTVVNEPYFKAYTGGVSAGGDFSTNGNCSGGGLLAGWNDNTGGQARGASSQLSALALIKITGVASAQAAVPTSSPPGTGLTFANTANGLTNTSNADSPTLGGNYDSTGGSHCLKDVAPPTNGGDTTSYNSSQTIAGSGAMSVSGNKSIFVNGDVYITHNITYSGSWAAGSGPSFVLRATGNIYIAPGVTELNGVYIAKHKIYTCGVNNGNNNFAPVNAGSLYGSCNTQLVVYGSFVAQQVNLMRTYGSLRNATAGEQPTSGSLSCSYSGGPGNKPSCAGEIFILSPGLYLTNPAINLPNNGAVQYDSITSLPPVL
jgi:hypothetical protein